MGRWSNNFIGIVSALTFLGSIVILGGGIWLAAKGDSVCARLLQWPVIGIGAFLMVLSIAGFLGGCFRVTRLRLLYLFFMFLLIILLLCIMIFAFVVTSKGAGEVVPNRGFKEYRLGNYSNWLRKRVDQSDNWKKVKICIQGAKICKSLADHSINETAQEFYSNNLSPIEWACCNPPTSCNFTYVNATHWTVNATSSANNMSTDCGLWSNNQNQLCYKCSTCKAGVLAELDHDWREVAIINVIALTVLIGVYSTACSAWKNNKNKQAFPTYRNGYNRSPK